MKHQEHILACLSGSPSNAKIVKTAAQMAVAFGGTFTALYVKTPTADLGGRENRERLQKHLRLAQELGAEIVTVYGEDIAAQIIEFARVSGVTKIVLGRSYVAGRGRLRRTSLTDHLIRSAPDIDIYIIPDADHPTKAPHLQVTSAVRLPSVRLWGLTLGILLLSTAIGFLFHFLEFTNTNIIIVYMLGVLLTALYSKNYLCSAAFSLISVILFNFFFTEPRLSLLAYEVGAPITFAIMLISSLLIGTLANRLAGSARQSAGAAWRTGVMLQTNQLLQKADSVDAVMTTMAEQLGKLLSRPIIVYPAEGDRLGDARLFFAEEESIAAMCNPQEQATARWVLQNRKRAGAGTSRRRDALCLYLSVRTSDAVFCVVGIKVGARVIEPFEDSIVVSLLGEAALAIENLRNAKEKEQIALLAKNEQLRADLLRSISHDLRTPLTSILGNTEALLTGHDALDPETRHILLTDVYDDAEWLISLVENLLSVTRLNEGRMQFVMTPQLVEEVITESLRHVSRKACDYHIATEYEDELLLAQMDARLISQVLINLVDNAIKYTPAGSQITVSARREGDFVAICVADNGPGIPDDRKEDVFQMFYTGENRVADCRRSLGLGLALCRSIVTAHGGTVTLTDNHPNGCRFTFTLPYSEVKLHE